MSNLCCQYGLVAVSERLELELAVGERLLQLVEEHDIRAQLVERVAHALCGNGLTQVDLELVEQLLDCFGLLLADRRRQLHLVAAQRHARHLVIRKLDARRVHNRLGTHTHKILN